MALDSKVTSADGMLTTSGLLYEGTFTQWLARVDAALILHRLHRHISSKAEHVSAGDLGPRRLQAERLIRSMVSPHLLHRLTDFDYTPAELFRILKMLAQPFRRLLDLPPELRETIFADVFSGVGTVTIFPRPGGDDAMSSIDRGLIAPKLLQVSQHIRKEAAPIFYKTTRFSVMLDIDGCRPENNIDDCLRPWLELLVKDNRRHIHHIELDLQWYTGWDPDLKTFGFNHHGTQGGLKAELPSDLVDESRARIEEHLANITKADETPGDQLISVLLDGQELWELGSLEYTSDDPETPF